MLFNVSVRLRTKNPSAKVAIGDWAVYLVYHLGGPRYLRVKKILMISIT